MIKTKTSSKAERKPTHTSLVLAALTKADDILSFAQIKALVPGSSVNQVSASLCHLAKRHAVENVVGNDEALWWFATPAADDRERIVEERAPEPKGNRTRKKREKAVPQYLTRRSWP